MCRCTSVSNVDNLKLMFVYESLFFRCLKELASLSLRLHRSIRYTLYGIRYTQKRYTYTLYTQANRASLIRTTLFVVLPHEFFE